MGANDKVKATYHGRTPDTEQLRDMWVDSNLDHLPRAVGIPLIPTVQAEFDRWFEQVKAEAKAEALEEMANDLESRLAGYTKENGQTLAGRDIIREMRNRAEQIRGGS